jgi:hypothetical protein
MWPKKNAFKILVGEPEGKRPPGRLKRRLVDNIKMNLRDIGWDGTDSIDLAQDTDKCRGSFEHSNELSDSEKCWEILE